MSGFVILPAVEFDGHIGVCQACWRTVPLSPWGPIAALQMGRHAASCFQGARSASSLTR